MVLYKIALLFYPTRLCRSKKEVDVPILYQKVRPKASVPYQTSPIIFHQIDATMMSTKSKIGVATAPALVKSEDLK
jgi:hypothetical protein